VKLKSNQQPGLLGVKFEEDWQFSDHLAEKAKK